MINYLAKLLSSGRMYNYSQTLDKAQVITTIQTIQQLINSGNQVGGNHIALLLSAIKLNHQIKPRMTQILYDLLQNQVRFKQPEQIKLLLSVLPLTSRQVEELMAFDTSFLEHLPPLERHCAKIIQSLKVQQNQLLEDLPVDFTDSTYAFWLKTAQARLIAQNPKEIDDFEWQIKLGKPLAPDWFFRYVQLNKNTGLDLHDILLQQYPHSDTLKISCELSQFDSIQLKRLFGYLRDFPPDLGVYRLFTKARYFHEEYLGWIEETIETQEVPLMDMLEFYANAPIEPGWRVTQILRRSLNSHWDKSRLNWRLRVMNYLFRIEKITQRPVPNANYLIMDSLLANRIEELVIGIRFGDLTQHEKLMVYFLFNCYYQSDMLSDSFNKSFAFYIQSYLRNQFQQQPRIQSNLQLSVEAALLKLKVPFQKEIFLDNCFAVDFLVRDKQVIEVNGPLHYFNGQLEDRKTMHKRMILERRGYRVIEISYFDWQKWGEKGVEVLDDLLRGLSLQDIRSVDKSV